MLRGIAQTIVCLALISSFVQCKADKKPLPILGKVPTFALVNQKAASFSSEALQGKVWIANFIFTRCPSICPGITQKMSYLQDLIAEQSLDVRLVSFSVDPEHDTAGVLDEYAKRYGADPERWSFLTGTPEDVRSAVRDGFKISMERVPGEVPDILHGSYFVLVDQQLQIRAYRDSEDEKALKQLMQDAKQLSARASR